MQKGGAKGADAEAEAEIEAAATAKAPRRQCHGGGRLYRPQVVIPPPPTQWGLRPTVNWGGTSPTPPPSP